MDLIKLLDVASPQTMKKTINQVITEFEDLTTSLNNSVGAAIGTASTAQAKAEQALASSETALTDSSNALVTAENALAMIEQADARSEEATSLAEQAFAEAQSATETAETAQAVALRAESTIDQVIGTGAFGTFVYDTNDIALSKVFLTDDITLEDTDERTYAPTPKAVKTAVEALSENVSSTIIPALDAKVSQITYSKNQTFSDGSDGGVIGRLYMRFRDDTENSIVANCQNVKFTVPVRDAAGNFYVGNPTQLYHTTTKTYVDTLANTKLDKIDNTGKASQVYASGSSGQEMIGIANTPAVYNIPRYDTNKNIKSSTPIDTNDVTPKEYVDAIHTDLTDYKASTDLTLDALRNRTALPIGSIITSAIPLTDAGVHLLDGSYIAQDGIYTAFTTLLKTLAQTYAITCTEEEFEASLSAIGNCGKFVINDTTGTIRLPKITRFVQGLTDLTNIGTSIEAGLPNVTGVFDYGIVGASYLGVNTATGAFYKGNPQTQNAVGGTIYQTVDSAVYLDASRSNAAYGKSSTVQPQATQYPYYIVLANSYQTDVQIDINQYTNELNAVLTTAASRFEERTKTDVVSGLSWNNFNVSVFDSVFGAGWSEKLGRYACRANASDDTSGVVAGLGYTGTYYVEIDIWYVGTSNNAGAIITIKDSNCVSSEASIIFTRSITQDLTYSFISLRTYSMVPRGIMESFSLFTEDFWDGKILYTATRNCICSFRWGSSAMGYLNMDVFNAQGAVCYSLSTQANVEFDTNTFVFPMSPGMYIKLENVGSVKVNWCSLQVCVAD